MRRRPRRGPAGRAGSSRGAPRPCRGRRMRHPNSHRARPDCRPASCCRSFSSAPSRRAGRAAPGRRAARACDTGVRPVARPQHALGRLLDQCPGQAADVLVLRRAGLRGLVRRRQLDPAAAGIDKAQQRPKLLGVRRHRIEKLADVVDDELARQALDLRLVLRQVAAVELDVGVPPEADARAPRPASMTSKPQHAARQRQDAHRARCPPW